MKAASIMAGALIAAASIPALAGVTETAVDRYVLVAAEGGFSTDGPRNTSGPASGVWLGDDFAAASEGGNGGSSNGYQDSSIANGLYSGFLDGRADSFGDGSDFASGYGQSHLSVDFNLAAGGDWALSGFVNAFGFINGETSEAYIRLIDLSDNSVVWGTFVNDAFEAFAEGGSLAAGNYRLEADALAAVNRIFETGFGDSTASVEFDFTVTPAPGSIALFGLAGLGWARRRRG